MQSVLSDSDPVTVDVGVMLTVRLLIRCFAGEQVGDIEQPVSYMSMLCVEHPIICVWLRSRTVIEVEEDPLRLHRP